MRKQYNPEKLFNYEEKESFFAFAIFNVLIIFFAALLLFVSFFQLCEIKGVSMQNTFNADVNSGNDHILLTRFKTDYSCNDIIVLDAYDDNNEETIRIVKRIVAVEGETFKFERDGLFVKLYKQNSEGEFYEFTESYIKEPMLHYVPEKNFYFNTRHFKYGTEYTVPENSVLYLGDNRNDSNDSRYFGFGLVSSIVGKCVFIPVKGSVLEKILILIYPDPKESK